MIEVKAYIYKGDLPFGMHTIGHLDENDSLRNELKIIKYYLEILKERVIFDTLKKR